VLEESRARCQHWTLGTRESALEPAQCSIGIEPAQKLVTAHGLQLLKHCLSSTRMRHLADVLQLTTPHEQTLHETAYSAPTRKRKLYRENALVSVETRNPHSRPCSRVSGNPPWMTSHIMRSLPSITTGSKPLSRASRASASPLLPSAPEDAAATTGRVGAPIPSVGRSSRSDKDRDDA